MKLALHASSSRCWSAMLPPERLSFRVAPVIYVFPAAKFTACLRRIHQILDFVNLAEPPRHGVQCALLHGGLTHIAAADRSSSATPGCAKCRAISYFSPSQTKSSTFDLASLSSYATLAPPCRLPCTYCRYPKWHPQCRDNATIRCGCDFLPCQCTGNKVSDVPILRI